MSAKALVVLADGFEDVEAVTAIDVLRRGGVEVVTAAIILPGGGEGTDNLKASTALAERLRRQKEEGRLLCAICAAPLVLVEAGVLEEGQHVTCYPTCSLDLDRPCAGVPVVADGNVITGQAPGASMLFALVVLKTLTDEKTAAKVARGMVTDVLD